MANWQWQTGLVPFGGVINGVWTASALIEIQPGRSLQRIITSGGPWGHHYEQHPNNGAAIFWPARSLRWGFGIHLAENNIDYETLVSRGYINFPVGTNTVDNTSIRQYWVWGQFSSQWESDFQPRAKSGPAATLQVHIIGNATLEQPSGMTSTVWPFTIEGGIFYRILTSSP